MVYPQGEWDTIDFDATDFDEDTDMIVYDTKADAPKDNLSKLDITASVDGKKYYDTAKQLPIRADKGCQARRF